MDYATLFLLLAAAVGISAAASADTMAGGGIDVTARLKEYFNRGPFNESRHPVQGAAARRTMLGFLDEETGVLLKRAETNGFNATKEKINFRTPIMYLGEHRPVEATNIILTFHGYLNKSDDEPLMILSNYDTDDNANYINEGSGVAAMLVLIEHLIREMSSNGNKIKHSVIFAFTDLASKKYGLNHAAESTTGATQIATSWLPQFLAHRKSFRGAIVLDNIMNYNETENTQIIADLGIDRSFSGAYKKMSDSKFAANFLGLVHRDDDLDNPLVKQIREGWRRSKDEVKNPDGKTPAIDPMLIEFPFEPDTFVSTAFTKFLESEQTPFWNHHVERSKREYPAVTLTDTRLFRECRTRSCTLAEMTTRTKLAFMKRTIYTLTAVILESQTDGNGALPLSQTSGVLLFSTILMVFMTKKLY